MRELNREKSKPIIVTDEKKRVMSTSKKKIEIIAEYFKKALSPEQMKEQIKTYDPCTMEQKFTGEEIEKASRKIRNGKSTGIDKCNAEFIKYAPSSIHNRIAEIYNRVAETGEKVDHMVEGLLTPLPKPGKKKGPPENLRPIILLSVLRKILTICLLERIWDRLEKEIPLEQAAYQSGRSTSEQVLALKLLAEKAILNSDYTIYVMLLDMSKAFDTVNRKTLFENLEKILRKDEIHILSIITNEPELRIKLESKKGSKFKTYQGIMQGDCLSAVLFVYYLSCALREEHQKEEDTVQQLDHNYAKTEIKSHHSNVAYPP